MDEADDEEVEVEDGLDGEGCSSTAPSDGDAVRRRDDELGVDRRAEDGDATELPEPAVSELLG